MGDRSNFAALEWVIGEIGETLNDARRALEAYVEDPRDTSRIRFCLTHIHQVLGSLQMVEFHGASLFAEEMEQLAGAIMHNRVVNEKEAQEVLMRSLLQLPHYLEQVKDFHDDHPGIVLPLLNDIRAVRKQTFLSETNLFNPDLTSLEEVSGECHAVLADAAKLREIIGKLKEMYQYAAASVLRGFKIDENLAYIDKVFVRLEGLTRGTRAHPLWQVSAALAEALVRDDVELSVAVRGLLRQLATQLRQFEEHSPQILSAPVSEPLLRNLLFYVARAEDGGRRVAQVKARFGLENALLGGGAERGKLRQGLISTPEPGAIRAVVVALQDELNTVKHLMNTALSGQGGVSDLEEMQPVVKRIGDTLAVLGIGDMRKLTMDQHDALKRMCASGKVVETDLIDVAGRLADIEHRLEAIGKGVGRRLDYASVDQREVEFDSAKEAVLLECRSGLDRVKGAIVDALSAQWNPSQLPSAVAVLKDIAGGLGILPLPRPAAILANCAKYIEERLSALEETPGEELQVLADAIASVDYYLERLAGTHGDELDSYLDVAEESLAQLGYATAPTGATSAAASGPVDDAEDQAPSDTQAAFESSQPADAEALLEAEAEAQSAPVEVVDTPSPAVAGEPPWQDRPLPSEQHVSTRDELDEEIIEIFIEEASEVLQTLGEHFPKWQDKLDDSETLMTVRRAFHTLKGSGRMVEAMDVSELAWGVEAMLNRLLDATVKAEPAHARLVGNVADFFPALVEAFKTQAPNPDRETWLRLAAQAEALTRGEIPRELTVPFKQPETEPEPASEARDPDSTGVDAPAEPLVEAPGHAIEEDEDQLLWDIFASEAETHLAVVDEFLAAMELAAPLYTMPTDALQSALHTLKGSAHMAGVKAIAAVVAPLEGLFKELRSYQVKVDKQILVLLDDSAQHTRRGLACIARGEPVVIEGEAELLARIEEQRIRTLDPLIHSKEQTGATPLRVDPKLLSLIMSEGMRILLDADEYIAKWRQDRDSLKEDLAPISAELATLEQAASEANLPQMQTLAALLGGVYQALAEARLHGSESLFALLEPAHEVLLDMVDQVAAGQNIVPVSDELAEAMAALVAGSAEGLVDEPFAYDLAEEFRDGFSEEEINRVLGEAGDFDDSEAPADAEVAAAETDQPDLQQDLAAEDSPHEDELETEDAASPAAEEHGGETGEDAAPSDAVETQEDAPPAATEALELTPDERDTDTTEDDLVDADEASVVLESDEDDVAQQEQAATEVDELEEVTTAPDSDATEAALAGAGAASDTEQSAPDEAQTPGQSPEDANEPPVLHEAVTTDSSGFFDELARPAASSDAREQAVDKTTTGEADADQADVAAIDTDVFDADILEIFLDEAFELIEELDEAIHTWEANWDDPKPCESMKRALHTLKGGARLSGLSRLGDLTHNYESYLILNQTPSAAFFQDVHQYQDTLLSAVKTVRARLDGDEAKSVGAPEIEVPELPDDTRDISPASLIEPAQSQVMPSAEVLPFVAQASTPAPNQEARAQNQSLADSSGKRPGSQEVIKVSADLLEELVNLAGETSISRGRLEQQVNDLGSAVDEVDATLRRLNEQLRRLDIETEAQVLFRQERMAQHEQFDPLEMDRYSHLQQLTRSLMESSSDLMDLKSTISDKLRDTETLLLQQQRINSSLQEGLMRSRMVPFSRLVPRLRRIVRQVSGELGKHVNFELDNVEGEMDRSVLERMVAPLEHMLRNAVDHGIESPQQRQSAGKPETGRILLSLVREGGDILLRLADDGRGINLERVRSKAIERGLMTEDAQLTDHDVMQFILQAGFSTVDSVTQISGRGVGMDVVAAEIKQLGGSMTIDSKAGVGTQFVVRLPFTVSVNRALMVQLGSESYAIPLNTIEGIVRVSPFELEHYYNHKDARFEYAGENYQVRYLGTMVTPQLLPKLEGQLLPLPVILVRSGQLTMALQVDALSGSREIVVKTLGPQFAAVQGISGATVMGDGSVVVILDPHALVRQEMATQGGFLSGTEDPAPKESTLLPSTLRTIMVVDDSVTVRKVTSRFLEREGFNVITAKDGVDALQVLHETTPDLMLLDIEMPRMDGFEVARNMRSTQRWKHTPIIMITSRTGDKHRQHAFSIGVNEYLGKPYQEESLLKAINTLLAKQSANG